MAAVQAEKDLLITTDRHSRKGRKHQEEAGCCLTLSHYTLPPAASSSLRSFRVAASCWFPPSPGIEAGSSLSPRLLLRRNLDRLETFLVVGGEGGVASSGWRSRS